MGRTRPAASGPGSVAAAQGEWADRARGGRQPVAAPGRCDQLGSVVLSRQRAAKNNAQLIPGWPYSFVAALETGRSSWTAVLDAVRLGPADDATASTATQRREVINQLIGAGHWQPGDPDIVIVTDSGYDITRLAFVLADLPVEFVGRLRSDRVLRFPKPARAPGTTGRPPKHRPEIALAKPATWPAPQHTTHTETSRYGTAVATSWDRVHPRQPAAPAGSTTPANYRSSKAP